MDLKSTYNKIAQDWFTDHDTSTQANPSIDKFASFLKEGDAVLDVGCGPGLKAKYLNSIGFKITGIDFSEEMIAIAKKNSPSSDFEVKDITKPLGFTEKFDGIFAHAVLLHIPKQEIKSVLQNLSAVLNSGGYLYVSVKELQAGNPQEEIVKESDYGYEYERFFSYYTLPEIKEYLEDSNFTVVFENLDTSRNASWVKVIAKKT